MSARAGAVLDVGEAAEALVAPSAREAWSPLLGGTLLAVDLARWASLGEARREALCAALRELPCPAVAVGPGGAPPDLVAAFDMVVAEPAELAALREAVARSPLAAQALVTCLRASEGLDVAGGLVLESAVYATLQAGPEFAAWRAAHPARGTPPRSTAPPLRVEREDGRLLLTLDCPERRNAFGTELRDALVEALWVAVADPTLRVVLRGAGPSFCSGGDLDEFGTLPDPATAHAVRTTRSPARLMAALADRVEVHVHGACVGAGVELPAFARRVIARADAWFALPELALGLVPGAGGTVSLPRRIGRQRTAWMALSGARIDAATAVAWGLVDEIQSGGVQSGDGG